MALERGKLSNVCIVAAGTSVGIVTVASSKKVYVKSILAHAGTATTATAQVYMCPTGFGTAISGAKTATNFGNTTIAKIAVSAIILLVH